MSVAITIRHVPEQVRDELATRAARSHRSLQEYLLNQIIELVSRPAVEDVVIRARERVKSAGIRLSAADILVAKDADRQ